MKKEINTEIQNEVFEELDQSIDIVIQELGGTGKSYIASTLGDMYRFYGQECAMFCLDVEQNISLTRLGERNSSGVLLPIQSDARKGVVTIDILNQQNKEAGIAEREAKKLLDSFMTDAKRSVYDFPGQGRSQFQKIFKENELGYALEMANKNVRVIIPVSEQKSLVSVSKIREMFTFSGDLAHLNNRIKFFVFFNPIRTTNVDLTYDEFLTTKEHQELSKLGNRYVPFCLQNVDSNVLKAIKDKPLSYHYDFEKKRPKNLEENAELQSIGMMNTGIAMRRVFLDPTPGKDSGFYHIVPKYFI
ncbi:hypothetical protein [Massilia sp. WG5]|uniref:hypothetical protein n=1 Tax=Massilia sp. WG5 TaxID=1707785 RepID=UPI0007065C13|nr:hypothetical protein [Massilia sp. WG5]ALK96613.1 hypothetical protein AM586_10350 [Massilia sp. WG5]